MKNHNQAYFEKIESFVYNERPRSNIEDVLKDEIREKDQKIVELNLKIELLEHHNSDLVCKYVEKNE